MKYALWDFGRWEEIEPWRKAYYYAFEYAERWIWRRVWRQGIRPHLRPRTHAREHYEHLIDFRVPPVVHGYVWELHDDGDYFAGRTRADFAVRTAYDDLCCFHGSTAQECRDEIAEFIADFAKDAGTHHRSGYRMEWHDHDPDDPELLTSRTAKSNAAETTK